MENELIVEQRGQALWLTINRPDKRNALNAAVIAGIAAGLAHAEADPEIRSVVLTGAGEQAFCAGADLQSGKSFAFDYAMPSNPYADLLRRAQAANIPIVARVDGVCLAGGMGLLALADLSVASPRASFGLPEAKVGVFPMQVLSVLQHQVPARALNEMCLLGATIDAGKALQFGLINEVADPLDAALERLLIALHANSPTALRRGLYAIKRTRTMPFEHAIAFCESQIGLLALTEDAREGTTAFREKRKPVWSGR